MGSTWKLVVTKTLRAQQSVAELNIVAADEVAAAAAAVAVAIL